MDERTVRDAHPEPIQIPAPASASRSEQSEMAEYCQKRSRRKVVAYHVEAESAFKTVVLIQGKPLGWRNCPSEASA